MKNFCKLIGITGTNGKTTTILLTHFIASQAGLRIAALEHWKGGRFFRRFLDKAISSGDDYLLVEAPAHALQQNLLPGNEFSAGVLTNISCSRASRHLGLRDYSGAKALFFHSLPEKAKGIFNADDPHALAHAREGEKELITYAVNYPLALITAKKIYCHGGSSSFDLQVNGDLSTFDRKLIQPGTARMRLPLPGVHNIVNALPAITLALLMGVDLQKVAAVLPEFPGIRRRLEIMRMGPLTVVDDAACNPEAIRAAFRSIADMPARRLVVLHGLNGGSGEGINRDNANMLAHCLRDRHNSLLIVTGSLRHNRDRVQRKEERAFTEAVHRAGLAAEYYPDLPDALQKALYSTGNEDLLLMLGGRSLDNAASLLGQASGKIGSHYSLQPELMPSMNEAAMIAENPS